MKTIIAAGGLVKNSHGELLFIFRRGKWDLPKGKLNKGEGIREAALREVEEECGIGNLKIICPLRKTYHTFELDGKNVLKETHWFLMETNWDKTPVPQADEDITLAIWAGRHQLDGLLGNSYDTIKDVVTGFLEFC